MKMNYRIRRKHFERFSQRRRNGEPVGLNAERSMLNTIGVDAQTTAANLPDRYLQTESRLRFREKVYHASQVRIPAICRPVHGDMYNAYHLVYLRGIKKALTRFLYSKQVPISASNPNMNQPRFNAFSTMHFNLGLMAVGDVAIVMPLAFFRVFSPKTHVQDGNWSQSGNTTASIWKRWDYWIGRSGRG